MVYLNNRSVKDSREDLDSFLPIVTSLIASAIAIGSQLGKRRGGGKKQIGTLNEKSILKKGTTK